MHHDFLFEMLTTWYMLVDLFEYVSRNYLIINQTAHTLLIPFNYSSFTKLFITLQDKGIVADNFSLSRNTESSDFDVTYVCMWVLLFKE